MARSANTATMNTVKEPEELSVWSHCGWTMTVDPRLRGELCDDLRTLRLFRVLKKEIQITKIVDHPNIIKLHETWETDRICFLVTE